MAIHHIRLSSAGGIRDPLCYGPILKCPVTAGVPGNGTMISDSAGIDDRMLTFEIQDDALERAAVGTGQAMTLGYCTQWYDCGWPL